jgi:hypothetical protein
LISPPESTHLYRGVLVNPCRSTRQIQRREAAFYAQAVVTSIFETVSIVYIRGGLPHAHAGILDRP